MRARIALAVFTAALAGAGLSVAAAATKESDRALFSVLSGKKEVNADTGKKNAGDPDGRGSFTAIVDGGELCFGIAVKNLEDPVAAHIHRGQPDENGPVVVTLTQPEDGDPGASSDCVTVPAATSKAILKNPGRYYANVHTGDFPGGAVRGQLRRRSN